jgi:hypothetical protein
MIRKTLLSGLLVSCLIVSSCAARVASTPTVPGRAATPLENVMAWNAALANANLGVATNIVAAQQSAPPLISVDAANRVLTAQSLIADGDRQLTFILQTLGTCLAKTPAVGASSCKASGPQINALIGQIEASSTAIVTNDAGIKDAKTSAAVIAAMKSIFALAQQMIGALQTGGLLQ